MKRRKASSGGQALIMVSLALIAMAGMLGLAVDLGWSFFVQKQAQAAADGAALSAVEEAVLRLRIDNVQISNFSCTGAYQGQTSTTVDCQSSTPSCSSFVGTHSNLLNGCQYALKNGFNWTAPQNVTMQSGSAPGSYPTTPAGASLGVNNISYWVTVRAVQTIPQLFSVVLGNTQGTVAAIATAAIAERTVQGDLILIGRQNDPTMPAFKGTAPKAGADLALQGGGTVTAGGGVTDASNSADAGTLAGSSSVVAPFTEVAGPTGHVDWTPSTNISSASNVFDDPEAGKGQPPLCPPGGTCSADYSHAIRVPGGNLSSVCSTACPPGVYYATTAGGTAPTGATLTIPDGTVFENTTGATSGFGNYVFVGGATVGGTVSMAAGRYVMVGTNSAGTDTLNVSGGTVIGGTSATSDAGRIIILTDSSYQAYSGDTNMATILAGLPAGLPALGFGPTEFKSGNGTTSFYGLDPGSSSLPSELQNFAPAVIWQDQQNSVIKYNTSGYPVDSGAPNYTPVAGGSTAANASLIFWGGASSTHGLSGLVYQPRGAYFYVHSADTVEGNFILVTGGIADQGHGELTLDAPPFPLIKPVTTLIQ